MLAGLVFTLGDVGISERDNGKSRKDVFPLPIVGSGLHFSRWGFTHSLHCYVATSRRHLMQGGFRFHRDIVVKATDNSDMIATLAVFEREETRRVLFSYYEEMTHFVSRYKSTWDCRK
jgi:hypothetical protein